MAYGSLLGPSFSTIGRVAGYGNRNGRSPFADPFSDSFGDPFDSSGSDPFDDSFGDPFSGKRKKNQNITPEEEELLKQTGGQNYSALQTFGHFLDTPGAFSRALLTGRNPFSAVVNPEERVYGQDILFGKDATGWGPYLGGLGFDIATDPLMYLSGLFGGAVRGAGGILARGAGQAVGKHMPQLLGRFGTGTRRGLQEGTLRKLAEVAAKAGEGEEFGKALVGYAKKSRVGKSRGLTGVNTLEELLQHPSGIADEPLGGSFGIHLPFTAAPQWVNKGSSWAGRTHAEFMDKLGENVLFGEAIRFHDPKTGEIISGLDPRALTPGARRSHTMGPISWAGSGVKKLAPLFGVENMGALDTAGQRLGRETYRAGEAARPKGALPALQTAKLLSQHPELRRLSGEQRRAIREIPDAYTPAEKAAFGLSEVSDETIAAGKQAWGPYGKATLERAAEEQYLGTRTSGHIPRYLHRAANVDPQTGRVYPSREVGWQAGSAQGRESHLTSGGGVGIPGDSHGINEGGRMAADILENPQIRDKKAAIMDMLDKRTSIPDLHLDKASGQLVKGRHGKLADTYMGFSPKKLREGVYANDPEYDAFIGETLSQQSHAQRKNTLQQLGDKSYWAEVQQSPRYAKDIAEGRVHDLDKVLDQLGYNSDTASERVAEMLGTTKQGLRDGFKVPQTMLDDMTRMHQAFEGPEAVKDVLKVLDWYTNAFRAGVTAWPAFSVRNFGSALLMNWIAGRFSFWSNSGAKRMADGLVLTPQQAEKLAGLHWVKEGLERLGLESTPENITQVAKLRAAAEGAFPTVGQHGESVVTAGGRQPGTLEDVLQKIPGERPTPPILSGEMGRTLLGKAPGTTPFPMTREGGKLKSAVRGVGDSVEEGGKQVGYQRAFDYLNNKVETQARLAPWLEEVSRGTDPTQAAMEVTASQVNYSTRALTPFERSVMLRAFPFYRFMKGMVPYTLKTLWENPGGKLGQTIRAQSTATKSGDVQGPIPEHIRDTLAIPLAGGPKGGQRFLTGMGTMHEDALNVAAPLATHAGMLAALATPLIPGTGGLLAKAPGAVRGAVGLAEFGGAAAGVNPIPLPFGIAERGPGIKDWGLEMWGRTNPLLKALYEIPSGTSAFQRGERGGRALEELDPTLGRTLANVAGLKEPVGTPDTLEYLLGASPLSRLGTTARTLSDPRKGAVTKALNTLTGLRVTDVSPQQIDALLHQEVGRGMKEMGAKTFEKPYFSKEQLQKMPPAERQQAVLLNELQKILSKRAKQRKREAA